MPWELKSYIVNPEDEIVMMSHSFYGRTKADCESTFQEHLGSCSYFRSAESEGRVVNKWIVISEDALPRAEKTK